MNLKETSFFPLFIIVLFLSIIFISCGREKNHAKTNPIPEMEFNINSRLLGDSVINKNVNISFNPPVNWKAVPAKDIKAASVSIGKALAKEKNINVNPLYIFVKEKGNSILNVADIKISTKENTYDSKMKKYQDFFIRNIDSSKVKKAVYFKNKIKITQFLIQKNGTVNFRLLFENSRKDIIQFDYLTSLKDYSNEVKAIESSIGSIKLI